MDGAKRVHTGRIGWPKRHSFQDFIFVPLSKSCFPPRAGSIFWETNTWFAKIGVGSMECTKKMADRIRNWQNCRCDAYTQFRWRGSGVEKCTALQPEAILWRRHGANKWRSERPKEWKKQIKRQQMLLLKPAWDQKSENFDQNRLKAFCKNVSPARAGTTIL